MRNKKLIAVISILSVLVLFIVVTSATFLVRHTEAYSYYVGSPPEYDQKVLEAGGIKKNSSMFMLDEKKIAARIEAAYPEVGVVNIERRFPDIVAVNYVVYGPSFQFLTGDTYYQCYSSGRIGGSSDTPNGGYFIAKLRDDAATTVGLCFQNGGYDFTLIKQFIDYLHRTGLSDSQIQERISFVDLSRMNSAGTDGYFYIRTKAGMSIEIRGTANSDDFLRCLDVGWSIFVDPDPALPVGKASGMVRAYMTGGGDEKKVSSTYSATDGDEYYKQNYILT